MRLDEGQNLILEGLAKFHGNFNKVYGQIALRLNDSEYLTSGDNKLLSEIKASDIQICDITTGDLGTIFEQREDINVFIYGCTQDIVEVSNSVDALSPSLDDLAYITGARLRVIDSASPSSILDGIKHSGMCLARGLGAFVASSDIRSAASALLVVKKSCEAYIHGKLIGGVKPIGDKNAQFLRDSYKTDYIKTNTDTIQFVEYDEKETESRSKLASHISKLGELDLNYGSWGNVSARKSDEEMFITPSAMEYDDIAYSDIVAVDLGTLTTSDSRVPSMDTPLHARMYKEIPGCNAIIHTHSNGCSVFAACEAGFAITDPTMHQLIGDVKVIPYTPDMSELADSVVETMKDTHAAILAHHGAIFYGPSIEVAFEIAKGVEMMAQKLLSFTPEAEE